MRHKKKERKAEKQRTSSKEPLTEGIQKKRREQRNWKSMTDKELVAYAKNYIRENEIKNRSNLAKVDSGLYKVLIYRRILNLVLPIKTQRIKWSSMTDNEIFDFIKKFIKNNNIKTETALKKKDMRLYSILRKRKLLTVVFPNKRKRQKRRDWFSMSDEELISYAKTYIEENGIRTRSSLQKVDGGLYLILRKKNLIPGIIPDGRKTRKRRNWVSISNEVLIKFANEFIEKNKIRKKSELEKLDPALCTVLRKRHLLSNILPSVIRNWSSMSDEELISYAKTYIEQNEIKTRKNLKEADGGLYAVLYKRKLLDVTFADVDQIKRVTQIKSIVDTMEDFNS